MLSLKSRRISHFHRSAAMCVPRILKKGVGGTREGFGDHVYKYIIQTDWAAEV